MTKVRNSKDYSNKDIYEQFSSKSSREKSMIGRDFLLGSKERIFQENHKFRMTSPKSRTPMLRQGRVKDKTIDETSID